MTHVLLVPLTPSFLHSGKSLKTSFPIVLSSVPDPGQQASEALLETLRAAHFSIPTSTMITWAYHREESNI